jgi:hypothetical protein
MTHVVTGNGDNPAEAIDDCLEIMARYGIETKGMEARIMCKLGFLTLPQHPTKCWGCEDREACDDCELHYYYSILYTLGGKEV